MSTWRVGCVGGGIGFEQRDNCFTRIDDLPRAQQMMQDLETRKWERFLNALARRVKQTLRQVPTITSPDDAVSVELQAQLWSMQQPDFAERLKARRKK